MLKKAKFYFLLIFLTELLSFAGFYYAAAREICFFAILIITLILSLQKLEYGLLILFAELFIGSKGYLFYFEQGGLVVSVRIALFLIIMSVCLAKILILCLKEGKKTALEKIKLPFWQYYALLAVAIIWGVLNGYLNSNAFNNIFFDANAWLYWLVILPLAYVVNEYGDTVKEWWRKLGAAFAAAVAWLAAETLALGYFFSHDFGAAAAQAVYKWIRVTGAGEITFTPLGFFRIFMQSQIYVLVALMIVAALVVYFKSVQEKRKLLNCYIVILLLLAVAIVSFSRSFWIGVVMGLLFFCFFVFWFFRQSWKEAFWQIGVLLSAVILSVALVFILVRFPFPQPIANFSPEFLAQRALSEEAGVSSRWNLLTPLWREIKQAPLFGKGFGAAVTYFTQDPRILEQSPAGEYTTYAFEWGYLDIWLKLGLVGLAIYVLLLSKIFYEGVKNYQFTIFNFQFLLNIALLSGLVMIMATSFFSPYLNHPLGIGYVVLLSFIMQNKKPQPLI